MQPRKFLYLHAPLMEDCKDHKDYIEPEMYNDIYSKTVYLLRLPLNTISSYYRDPSIPSHNEMDLRELVIIFSPQSSVCAGFSAC